MRIVLLVVVVLAVTFTFYSATRSARVVAGAEQQAMELTRELQQAREALQEQESGVRQFFASTIPPAMEGHTRLLTTMARQFRPGAEWSSNAVNTQTLQAAYEKTFTDFLSDPGRRKAFPNFTAPILYRLGQMSFLVGNHLAARRMLGESIAVANSIEDHATAGLASNTLGCLHTALGEYRAALDDFQESLELLGNSRDHLVPAALVFRNIGLIRRSLDSDGVPSLRRAIEMLSSIASNKQFTNANELLIDTRMALCEMHWATGELDLALEQCQLSRRELLQQLELTRNFGKPGTIRNRYTDALRLVDRDIFRLTSLIESGEHTTSAVVPSRQFASGWEWLPLFDLKSELVSTDLTVTATMSAEFDQQNGLLLAWGMYDWTERLVVEIAKLAWKRCRLIVIADNRESLAEAKRSFHEAEIPLSKVSFDNCAHETSWFRDGGPIVGRTQDGSMVWFDAQLTRQELPRRLVTDALPALISNEWEIHFVDSSRPSQFGGALHCLMSNLGETPYLGKPPL